MLYFDLAIYNEDLLKDSEKKFPKLLKDIIYNFRKITGQVLKLNVDGKNLVVLPKVNNRVLKKVSKILKVDVTRNVCVSENLRLKEDFIKFLNSKNLNVLDGRWLFKYLFTDVLEFICNSKEMRIENQEISILTNEMSPFIYETIKKVAEKVKNINIVTRNIDIFKKLEADIYEENGMIIRVTNDFKKATLKSNVILNLNFVQEYLDKINFGRNAIIVNFEQALKIKQKGFNGKVINFYHINLPYKILDRFNRFDNSIFYESLIYKKTLPKNIWNEIKNDKIKIDSLEDSKKNYIFEKLDNTAIKDNLVKASHF